MALPQQGVVSAVPALAKKPSTGLAGLFGGYDLGTRMRMAGAHLQGNPGAAAAMAQDMYKRKLQQGAVSAALAEHPEWAPLLQSNPEMLNTLIEQDLRAKEAAATRKESRTYEEGRTLETRKYEADQAAAKLAATPEAMYHKQFDPQIASGAKALATPVPVSSGGITVGQSANPALPDGMNPRTAAIVKALGANGASPDEALMLAAAYDKGPEAVALAQSKIMDDRRQASKDAASLAQQGETNRLAVMSPEMKAFVETGGDPKDTKGFSKFYSELKSGGDRTKTETIVGKDGKPHVFAFNPTTGRYDVDQGVKPEAAGFSTTIKNADGTTTTIQMGKGGDDGISAKGGYIDPKTGTMKYVPGSEGALKQEAEAKKAVEDAQASKISSLNAIRNVDKALELVDQTGTGGFIGGTTKGVPGSPAFNLEQALEPIRAATTLDGLKQSRMQSTTGASGFGPLTEREGQLLASLQGSLVIGQDPAQMKQALESYKEFQTALAQGPEAYAKFLDKLEQRVLGGSLPPPTSLGSGAPDAQGWRTVNGVRIREKVQ